MKYEVSDSRACSNKSLKIVTEGTDGVIEMGKKSYTVRLYRSKRNWDLHGPYKSSRGVLNAVKRLLPDLEPMKYGLLVERLE